MHNSQRYKPTFILITLIIAFYVYTSLVGGNFIETDYSMILLYGQRGVDVFAGQYYQLLTSIFVHASVVHLAGNMIFLLIFGLRGEELFSLPEYLLVYFVGGLTGNMLSLVFLPLNVPSVGASGAIFAMFGAATLYARRTVGQSILGALIYAFFLLFLSVAPGVNILAHLGGLGTGLLIGYALSMRRKPAAKYAVSYSLGTR
ncbi:MAG TPA: rhomboid family intramembrane serine protease [Candidatus Bathyarchaeia archaeon]|nr:rhomboid family intramembrane serine protease [Candidatus Bathyarchaeia archaeon]